MKTGKIQAECQLEEFPVAHLLHRRISDTVGDFKRPSGCHISYGTICNSYTPPGSTWWEFAVYIQLYHTYHLGPVLILPTYTRASSYTHAHTHTYIHAHTWKPPGYLPVETV